MAQHTGAEMFADMFAGYGVSHVFFVPTILNRALVEMERRTDITRIVTHAEKAGHQSLNARRRRRDHSPSPPAVVPGRHNG